MENNIIIDAFQHIYSKSNISSKRAFGEQILYLLFARLLGLLDSQIRSASKEEASFFIKDLFHLRWENIVAASPEEQFRLISGLPTRQEQENWQVCPWMNMFLFFRSGLKNTALKEIAGCFQDAEFRVSDCQVLSQMIQFVDELPIEGEFRDNFDYYAYVFMSSGIPGVEYTPKVMTELMTELADPSLGDKVCDPACGNGNFLVQALEYSKKKANKSAGDASDEQLFYYGYDINMTSARLAVVNMLLHQCRAIQIAQKDTISRRSKFYSEFANAFDRVILQPPFGATSSGEDMPECFIPFVKISGSDILFVALAEHILKTGGRGVVCLPVNFLFRSAYKAIRKRLVENNQLEAIVFLPSSRVSTVLLVFKKSETTDKVLFYKFEKDSESKNSEISNEAADSFRNTWKTWNRQKDDKSPEALDAFKNKKNKYFYITREDIMSSGYDLSFEKYHKFELIPEDTPSPDELLRKLQSQEQEINTLINQIKKFIIE